MSQIHQILKQYWGFENFRDGQQDIIESVLAGNDTLALLPTGGGKSMCYQVPALLMNGVCLVVSPLIALMKDQVQQLRKKNILAAAIISGMSPREIQNVIDNAHHQRLKFIYVSPERLQQPLFREQLAHLPISLIAVDEAHCISQWGYDFRPPYLQIANIKELHKTAPILALTATATPDVQQDICSKLEMKNPKIFAKSFVRHNLMFVVRKDETKQNKLVEVLEKINGSSIVYVRNRRLTKVLAEWLNQHKIKSEFYHAGLLQKERNKKQEWWMQNRVQSIVCTNAFGMGIDKPDVRCVVHMDLPDSPEAYFQEAGRAGRDGRNAFVVLIYNEDDVNNLQQSLQNNFPTNDDIKRTYEALMHYLQIAVGSGEQQFFDFDFNAFCEKFNLPSMMAVQSLKLLQQQNFLILTESVALPSRAMFVANREELYRFEVENKKLEPLVKMLLRFHSGIRDGYAALLESKMMNELKINQPQLHQLLIQLQQQNIIDYSPAKDKPQIILQQNRMKLEQLELNNSYLQMLKEKAAHRIQSMIAYVENETVCRSTFQLNYFGEENMLPCGKCDVCFSLRKKNYSAEKMMKVYGILKDEFEKRPFTILNAKKILKSMSNDDVLYFLEWLRNEDKIVLKNEMLRMK